MYHGAPEVGTYTMPEYAITHSPATTTRSNRGFERALPVSSKAYCLAIFPYRSPLAPLARGFCFGA